MATAALLVIDVQNDYFPNGKLPMWQAEQTLDPIIAAIKKAQAKNMPVIFIQHIVPAPADPSRFFLEGTPGAEMHPRLRQAAPDARIVIKHHADAFNQTELNAVLDSLGVTDVYVCGMQTQNCVGLTAISRHAFGKRCTILGDCCTSETPMVHAIALAGFGDIVPVKNRDDVL